MNRRDNLNLGDEIKSIVQDALNNKNFNKLNQNIGNAVKDALDEARRSIDWKPENHKNQGNKSWNNKTYNYNQNIDEKDSRIFRDLQTRTVVNNNSKLSIKRTKHIVPVGQVTGMVLTVLGSIATAAFGTALFVLTLLGMILGTLFHTIAAFLLPLLIFSVFVLISGNSIRKRLKRFQMYVSYMKDRDYCLISDLSSLTGLSNKYIEKDLRKMIKVGMFPEGKIDDKKTTFILTNECYKQYIELKRSMAINNSDKLGTFKHATTHQEQKTENKVTKKDALDPEIRKAINEGRKLITEIKQANILIPGQEISRKLDKLEILVGKIFDYVEIHPEKFVQIKKFTEYFLPTTFKLVDAYKNLDYQPIQGENISNAKKEIEETMDTINLAFENLLDDLFHDMSMDISTDISVLETMFAQEGLTENIMRTKNNTMEDKE